MDDLISRQQAIDDIWTVSPLVRLDRKWVDRWLRQLPPAQPEIKPIEYLDCANAMLKMWMDNVVTDGEYNRIMAKLNAHWGMKNG